MKLAGLNLGGFYSQVKDDIFTERHLDSFVTEDDFKRIKDWGFNCVRLPVDHFFFETEPFKYDESRLNRIDKTISLAEKNNLTLIFDLHKSAGHSFDFKERFNNNIWEKSSENRKRFLALWEMLAKRFKSREKIVLELLNEPVAPEPSQVNELYDEAIDAIRSRDRYHSIMIESNLWGACHMFDKLKKFEDNNIIYSFHFYEPVIVTHQLAPWMSYVIHNIYKKKVNYPGRPEGLSEILPEVRKKDDRMAEMLENNDRFWDKQGLEKLLEPVINFRNKYNVPVLCGEFGIVVLADHETRKNWLIDFMSILKKNDISFTYWSYKNMDFGVIDDTEEYALNPNYDETGTDKVTLKILRDAV